MSHAAHDPDFSDPSSPLDGPISREFGLLEEQGDAWIDQVRVAESHDDLGCLGDFELLEEVSRGGQGVVYRARRLGSEEIVALKRLVAGAYATERNRRRFEREIEAAQSLDHPHVIRVFELQVIQHQPILIMEWIDGMDVRSWARSEPRRVDEILHMFLAVGSGVQHAHHRGILHRDLKPSNVLVTADGHPKVVDFGLAKLGLLAPLEDSLTLSTDFIGTPEYAAPEQVTRRGDMDVRTDVYSLCVILYELLTGRLPYDRGESLPDTLAAILNEEPKRPSAVTQGLDRELDVILLKGLSKLREHRYQSVGELLEDLERYVNGEPIWAHGPSAWYLLRKLMRRHLWAFAIAASLFVITTAFALFAIVQAESIKRERDAALLAKAREREARTLAEEEGRLARDAEARASEALAKATLAREAAVADADRTRALYRFLNEHVLAPVLPHRQGRNVSLLSVLGEAADAINREFGRQPVLRAMMHQTVGGTYLSLGMMRAAEEHLQESLALHQSFDAQEEGLATTHLYLGHLRMAQGDYHRAADHYRRALSHQKGAAFLEDAAQTKGFLGHVLVSQGAYAEADALYQEALETHLELFGGAHLSVARLLRAQASLRTSQGDFEAAERLSRQALDAVQDVPGAELDLAVSLVTRGNYFHAIGRFPEAERCHRKALAIRRARLGSEHVHVATSLHQVGTMLLCQDRGAEAEEYLREALEIQRAAWGRDENLTITETFNALATVYLERGDSVAALDLMEKSLSEARRTLGPEHAVVANLMTNMSGVLLKLERVDEAERLMRDALGLRRKLLGEDHPDLAHSLNGLGWLLREKGGEAALAESTSCYEEALGVLERAHRSAHPFMLVVQNNLALARGREGRAQESEALFMKTLERARELEMPENHTDVFAARRSVLRALRLNDSSKALEFARGWVEVCVRTLRPLDPTRMVSEACLAELLLDHGSPEEAEKLLTHLYAKAQGHLPVDHKDLRLLRALLSKAYAALGRHEEADRLTATKELKR